MKSWKTSTGGIVMLLCAIAIVFRDPKSLTDPHVVALLVGGASLVVAADNKPDPPAVV